MRATRSVSHARGKDGDTRRTAGCPSAAPAGTFQRQCCAARQTPASKPRQADPGAMIAPAQSPKRRREEQDIFWFFVIAGLLAAMVALVADGLMAARNDAARVAQGPASVAQPTQETSTGQQEYDEK